MKQTNRKIIPTASSVLKKQPGRGKTASISPNPRHIGRTIAQSPLFDQDTKSVLAVVPPAQCPTSPSREVTYETTSTHLSST